MAGEQVEGGAVRVGVDAEGAEDAQLLVDDVVGVDAGGGLTAGAGDDEGAAAAGERHALRERGRRVGGDVDDDVGAARAGGPPEGGHRVLLGHVDDEVGAEALGRLEAGVVALAGAGDHHELGAGVLGGRAHAEAADARAEHRDHDRPAVVPGTVTPQRMPAPSGLNTVASTGSSPSGTGSSIESGPRYWWVA